MPTAVPSLLVVVLTTEPPAPVPSHPPAPPARGQLLYPELDDEQYTQPAPAFLL